MALTPLNHPSPAPATPPNLTRDDTVPRTTEEFPARFDSYELIRKIGQGGMASVYEARRSDNGERVAIKILSARMANDRVLTKRFEQEFQAASRLNHRNIVRCLDFGHTESGPYLVMEFVEGESLGDRIAREGALPPAEAVTLTVQVARALDYAHQEGVIHRDVKPDNIMITPEGIARLTDFGLVKQPAEDFDLTRPGQGLGTPNFIAPEQLLSAKTIDCRCDVYGLGATLYMAVTGRCPFAGKTLPVVLKKKALNELVLPRQIVPSLSLQLEQLICRAMHPDAGQRPRSCGELLSLLTGTLPASESSLVGRQAGVGRASRLAASGKSPAAKSAPGHNPPALPTGLRRPRPTDTELNAGSVGWPWLLAGAIAIGVVAGILIAVLH